ncbi:DUF742 domain-containing protein [Actinokineospora inagensis]|uniref:DUF742 domain-containing protein n=1 Tax=Actinokineospora inagensis TaxID=103730 RepID=UPI00040720AD|nr:DUF742 domain-containing protein [Actinokineospora inagensis]
MHSDEPTSHGPAGTRLAVPDRLSSPAVRPRQPPPGEVSDAEWMTRPESHALVRPYAWTGGRTQSRPDLAVEALVSTVREPRRASWEHRLVAELCVQARSVAEVAALIPVPLGVARVLISDLADQGVLVVHGVAGAKPDLDFMRRVLAGLRGL